MAMTSQQLVTLACQIAKCPGYITQAGQLLNVILQDLAQTYDFELARGITTLTLVSGQSGPNPLPADWLRANRDDVFYTVFGVPTVMTNVDLSEFDSMIQQAGLSSYPEIYSTMFDSTGALPPQMYVWPPPAGSFVVTARYYRQMPDIASPETSSVVPWFPNQAYLKTRLAGELMEITDDERAPTFLGTDESGAQGILTRYLKLQGDDENRAKRVTLDRRFFGSALSRVRDTKLTGF